MHLKESPQSVHTNYLYGRVHRCFLHSGQHPQLCYKNTIQYPEEAETWRTTTQTQQRRCIQGGQHVGSTNMREIMLARISDGHAGGKAVGERNVQRLLRRYKDKQTSTFVATFVHGLRRLRYYTTRGARRHRLPCVSRKLSNVSPSLLRLAYSGELKCAL